MIKKEEESDFEEEYHVKSKVPKIKKIDYLEEKPEKENVPYFKLISKAVEEQTIEEKDSPALN